jgi:hypothetical protein
MFALMFMPLMGAVCGSVLNPPLVIGAFEFALVVALVVAFVDAFGFVVDPGLVVEVADRPISEDTLGDPERSDLGVRQPVAASTRLNPQPAKTPIRRSIGKTPKSLDMKRFAREADGFRFQTNHRFSPRSIPITFARPSLRYAIRPTGIPSRARPEREPPGASTRAEYDGAGSYRFRSIGQPQSPRTFQKFRISSRSSRGKSLATVHPISLLHQFIREFEHRFGRVVGRSIRAVSVTDDRSEIR